MKRHDVVIAGAGPAGSASAAFLAERGWDVLLIERARFPRPKPCAEYLSPEAGRVLDRLGVTERLIAAGAATLTGMRVVSPSGSSFVGRFAAQHGYRGYRDHGLALRRELLDAELALTARAGGAALREGTLVESVGRLRDGARTLTLRSSGAEATETVEARLVIGADGLNSRIARSLALSRRGNRRRVAVVTHAEHVEGMGDVGEMHVGVRGYVGLAPVGNGITNIAAVADLARIVHRGGPKAWLDQVIDGLPEVAGRLSGARMISPLRAVGPFARWTRRATADHALLVGDAADFYDPFTGEGIFAALRGAELAAEQADRALAANQLRAADLAPYDRARRRNFGGKWKFERIVSWVVAVPAVIDRVARRLATRPDLADLLVGVSGDFVPFSRLLRPDLLWHLAL